MSNVITFNGTAAPSWIVFEAPDTPAPERSLTLESVPGMPGAYLSGYTDGVRVFEFAVTVDASTIAEAIAREDLLIAWATTDAPAALILDADPTRIVFAMLDGGIDLAWIGTARRGTLRFVCPNPTRWAAVDTTTALDTTTDVSPFDTTVTNAGGAPTKPVFVLPFTAPATFARVSCGDSYVQIGSPVPVDATPFVPRTSILHDDCSSLTGWGTGTSGGAVAGTMATSGTNFSPKASGGSFGTGAGWHGPTIRKVLGSPVHDFDSTVRIGLDNLTPKGSMVYVSIYFLDAAHAIVAQMHLHDSSVSVARNTATFLVGSKVLLETTGTTKSTNYNDFAGFLWVTRVAGKWTVKVGRGDFATRYYVKTSTPWQETAETADIAEVEVRVAQHGTSPVTNTCLVSQFDVVSINAPADDDVPIIAVAGDTLTFDNAIGKIYRTAAGDASPEPYMEFFDFESDFFALPAGTPTVSVATDGTIVGATETHRDCWR